MNYACIRDCSICPFRCFDVSRRVFRHIEKISKIPTKTQKSEENNDIKSNFAENTQKLSEFEQKTEILNEENEKLADTNNLPILSTIQYQVTKNPSPKKKKTLLSIIRRD